MWGSSGSKRQGLASFGSIWLLCSHSTLTHILSAPPPQCTCMHCQLHACAELTADRQSGPKVISFVLTAYQSLTLKVPQSILLEQLCKLSVQRRNQQARTHVRVGKPCKCELCLQEIYANSLLTRTETQKPAGPGWVWIHFTETEGGMFPPSLQPPSPGTRRTSFLLSPSFRNTHTGTGLESFINRSDPSTPTRAHQNPTGLSCHLLAPPSST